MFNQILVFVILFVGVYSFKFPASIQQCKFGDTDCLRDVMTNVIQTQTSGNEEFALMPLDPLKLDKLSILQNQNSPVSIRLSLFNVTLTGIKDIVITKVVGFEEIPMKSKFEVTGKTKRLTIFGKYILSGKILFLPVTGNGNANFTFENVNIDIKVIPQTEMRDGKEYAPIKNVIVKFSTTKDQQQFERTDARQLV
ncbi:protein takeout-like isoform X2 [Sitodiplosis mosellana]|uniref:protein takeout-like isoform X2 n=1 Tax=Sitodiplosis mosellana TaxID=263140 RepID=UPI0024439C13|nr:protein takeout-like isoform X2 [Sitodiplosis mosellana]